MVTNFAILFIMIFLSFSTHAGIEEIFEGKTSIEEPLKLRDPFQAPKEKLVRQERPGEAKKNSDGIYTNLEEIGVVPLKDIKITGILIGRDRRAIVSVTGKKTPFIIHEGNKLGENQAEVKAIVPGGLILVEKVVNIYGETEFLETVIPISK